MISIYNNKEDSKKCLWFGHKLRILKDDKTIWCDRCNRKISVYKKGYAWFGLDSIREKEARLFWVFIKIIFFILMVILIIRTIK